MVRNSDHNNYIFFQGVDNAERESVQQSSSKI